MFFKIYFRAFYVFGVKICEYVKGGRNLALAWKMGKFTQKQDFKIKILNLQPSQTR